MCCQELGEVLERVQELEASWSDCSASPAGRWYQTIGFNKKQIHVDSKSSPLIESGQWAADQICDENMGVSMG